MLSEKALEWHIEHLHAFIDELRFNEQIDYRTYSMMWQSLDAITQRVDDLQDENDCLAAALSLAQARAADTEAERNAALEALEAKNTNDTP